MKIELRIVAQVESTLDPGDHWWIAVEACPSCKGKLVVNVDFSVAACQDCFEVFLLRKRRDFAPKIGATLPAMLEALPNNTRKQAARVIAENFIPEVREQ